MISKTSVTFILIILGAIAGYYGIRYIKHRADDIHHDWAPNHSKEGEDITEFLNQAFNRHKNKYGLFFGESENRVRFAIFCDNLKKINQHNIKFNTGFKLGLNSLAHLTQEEFSAIMLGYNGKKQQTQSRTVHTTSSSTTPESIDWTSLGAVTPIKDQGQCGSCWAFSAVGALEGLNFIKNKTLEALSEQELVDCSSSYGNEGCNGGLMDYAFQYVATHGIASETAYPYTAFDSHCQTHPKVFQISNSTDVPANNCSALVDAIAQQPISVAIDANTFEFQLYNNGIFNTTDCGTELNHGVLAVGYGKDFIKVKNSWGVGWGEQGYIRIARAEDDGVCGINKQPSYPTL